MNRTPHLLHSTRARCNAGFFLGCVFALLFYTTAAAAESAASTGTLSGRVSDAATGKSLQGAIVRVLGTSARDYTDADGRYSLPGVPAGTQRIEVDYVGLDPFVQEVNVGASAPATFNAALESKALTMEAVTVAESARGQALAINQQKTAEGIVNIVSEETFGQMINGNIGYSLQRLPGLTVNEDEDGTPTGVNIRGLESKYNSFQIDGNRLPTSGNSRGFSTNQLSADGISNIEVVKAATPDRDGDAIGGIINVISRSAFQRDGRSFELTGSGLYYNKYDKWGYNLGATYLDLFNVFGGQKNLGVSFNVTTYQSARDYDNLDKDYAYLTPQLAPNLGLKEPVYFHVNGTPQTNFRDTTSTGFSGSIDFRASDHATFYVRPFYTHSTLDAEKPRDRLYVNAAGSFTATSAAQIAQADYNTGRSLPTVLTEYRYQNEKSTTDNDAYGVSLGGKHELGTLALNYDAFASANESNRDHSTAYTVRNQGFSIAYDQSDRAHPKYTILNGKDPYDLTSVNRGDVTVAPRDAVEKAMSVKADLEQKFVGSELSGSLKVGAKLRVNTKQQDQASFAYRTGTNASGFPYASLMRPSNRTVMGIPMTLEPDIDKLEALMRASPNLFALDAAGAARDAVVNDYRAEEDINAGYLMGTLVAGKTTLIAGLRAEQNTFKSDTWRFNTATPNAPAAVHAKRDYTVWLPGVHLRHELQKNLIFRASYNKSYSRPDIDKLVGGLQLDPATGNISGGNPNLKETTSNNFDAQVEYYTPRGGLYSVGVFYKKMEGFYYSSTYRFSTTDASGYPIQDASGPYVFSTTLNALGAKNYGVELIARQKLFFLPKPFDGFSLITSATFTDSDGRYPGRLEEKLPTYGFSDTIYNVGIEYVAGKFRGQLTYTYRSDYLEGLDVDNTFDDYFGAYRSLNWESSYQFNRRLRFFFNVNNITDEPQVSYQGYRHTDNPEDYTTYSWRATLGTTVHF